MERCDLILHLFCTGAHPWFQNCLGKYHKSEDAQVVCHPPIKSLKSAQGAFTGTKKEVINRAETYG